MVHIKLSGYIKINNRLKFSELKKIFLAFHICIKINREFKISMH